MRLNSSLGSKKRNETKIRELHCSVETLKETPIPPGLTKESQYDWMRQSAPCLFQSYNHLTCEILRLELDPDQVAASGILMCGTNVIKDL